MAAKTAPEGYLFCDGKTYNISDYPDLANAIKDGLGSYNYYGGDGTTTFAVPNLQGEFLRGYSTSGNDSKVTGYTTADVGLHQDATTHKHFAAGTGGNIITARNTDAMSNEDKIITSGSVIIPTATGSAWSSSIASLVTSRPTNTSVLYCIKY